MDLDKDGLPVGYFSAEDIVAYRGLIAKVPDGGVAMEIGVYKGRSICAVAPLAKQRGIHMWAVDPWYANLGLDAMLYQFKNHLIYFSLNETVIPMRSPSHMLAPFFPSHSLDLIFLDGPHDYENVKLDIQSWLPKVKPGGWIGGHDYDEKGDSWPGVKQATHEAFGDRSHAARDGSTVWMHQV